MGAFVDLYIQFAILRLIFAAKSSIMCAAKKRVLKPRDITDTVTG